MMENANLAKRSSRAVSPPDSGAVLGDRVSFALKQLGTQDAAASVLGISLSTVKSYSKGATFPTLDVAEKLCAASGISPEWLLTGRGGVWGSRAAVSISHFLTETQERLERAEVPISAEMREAHPDLEASFLQLLEIANDPSINDPVRAQADLMLDLGFADRDAAERRRKRENTVGARVQAAREACEAIAEQMGWSPPALTMMAIQNRMAFGALTSEDAREVLEGLRRDLRHMDLSGA